MSIQTVAQLTESTVEELAECLLSTVQAGASIGFLEGFSLEQSRQYWRNVGDRLDDDLRLIVALHQGRVAGAIQLHRCSKDNGRHRGEVQKLLVTPSQRGQGLAGQLLRAAERMAWQLGLRLLVLDTEQGSVAERLYQRAGWQRVGEIPDYALAADGTPVTTVYYFKQVSDDEG